MATRKLIEAVAVTAELCGRALSEPAARVFVMDLDRFPESSVLDALSRCRREVRGVLTLSDVIARLDDGRPGVEEAWSRLPVDDELASCMMTDEMATALGVASRLIRDGDLIAARMAFKESYQRELQKARDQARPIRWFPSLGRDPAGREALLNEAVQRGQLTSNQASSLLGAPSVVLQISHAAPGAASSQLVSHENGVSAAAIAGLKSIKELLARMPVLRQSQTEERPLRTH